VRRQQNRFGITVHLFVQPPPLNIFQLFCFSIRLIVKRVRGAPQADARLLVQNSAAASMPQENTVRGR
jgi:hypothetical protein